MLICGLAVCRIQAGQAQNESGASVPPVKKHAAHATKSAAPAAAPRITITMRADSEVVRGTFTLGEIADIAGADKALVAQLAAIEIGTSPLPGLSRLLYPGDITVRLRANHLESKRVQVLAPSSMRVTRIGHDVSADQITQAAIVAAQVAIKDIPNATLELIPTTTHVTVPAGKVQILAGAYRGSLEQGTLVVPVSLMVDGQPMQVVDIPLRVHRKAMVLVANRVIEAHEILSATDVSLVLTELPSGFTQPITDLQAAIGKRTTRRIQADMPISATVLETPPAISANDRITIEYAFGPIRITAPGLAHQSGAVGDTIRVYALDTQKELDAVIVNSRTVRIADNEDDNAGDGTDAQSGSSNP
jgi:flagella basal body P-ring formation protein FlgA